MIISKRAIPRRTVLQGLGAVVALPFLDASFDSVVCTFSLCAIPDHEQAVSQMNRVLRPGGRLLLADHVAGANWLVRGVQHVRDLQARMGCNGSGLAIEKTIT